ncbi:MAG: hypothetical protein ABJH04_10865 [Cyclobacteriaceae bacterium]
MEIVKQAGQIFKSIVLSGFILLILSGSVAAGNDAALATNSHQSTHISLAATDLLSLTTNTERFFEENIQRLLSAPSKLSFGAYLAVVSTTESYRSHLLTKCIACTRFMVPRFDQQDIVFPFHHFW